MAAGLVEVHMLKMLRTPIPVAVLVCKCCSGCQFERAGQCHVVEDLLLLLEAVGRQPSAGS